MFCANIFDAKVVIHNEAKCDWPPCVFPQAWCVMAVSVFGEKKPSSWFLVSIPAWGRPYILQRISIYTFPWWTSMVRL